MDAGFCLFVLGCGLTIFTAFNAVGVGQGHYCLLLNDMTTNGVCERAFLGDKKKPELKITKFGGFNQDDRVRADRKKGIGRIIIVS